MNDIITKQKIASILQSNLLGIACGIEDIIFCFHLICSVMEV